MVVVLDWQAEKMTAAKATASHIGMSLYIFIIFKELLVGKVQVIYELIAGR